MLHVSNIQPCGLCGTPKTQVEANGTTFSCPHCDRVSCIQSTCSFEPCISLERKRQKKEDPS